MRASLVLLLLGAFSCGSDKVSSAEDARRAYHGLDRAIDLALNLGMAGYNAAQSANIPAQSGDGQVSGTLTVSGQVDQGASNNKEMRLDTAFVMYEDRVPGTADGGSGVASGITYDTDAAALPRLSLSLRGVPDGTYTGTLNGTVAMRGDLDGAVMLALTLAGDLEPVPGHDDQIQRTPGTTRVTGTATSSYGTYTVDLTR
jgi:hypothetical protein